MRQADRHRDADLLLDALRQMGERDRAALRPCRRSVPFEIEKRLIDRERLNEGRELEHERA
jgi:hypothetical protein